MFVSQIFDQYPTNFTLLQVYLGASLGEKCWISTFLWNVMNHKKPTLFLAELVKHIYGDELAYRCLNLNTTQLNIIGLKEFTPQKLDQIISKKEKIEISKVYFYNQRHGESTAQ